MNYLRLKKAKDITAVLKNGKRVYAETLILVYTPAKETAMAVCVGKKYGKSVQRNALKRLLREAFRASLPLSVSANILLMPKVSETYSYAAFQRDIARILKKEKLVERAAS